MSSVDERVVKMTFDNKQFESGVKQSIKSLDDLDKKINLDKTSRKLETIEESAKKLDKVKFDNMGDSMEKVIAKFGTMDAVAFSVVNNITNSVLNSAKKVATAVPNMIKEGGWNRALNIDKAKFLFEGMKIDVEKGMNDALKAVKGTAYGLDEAAKVASQLSASGTKLGKDMQTSLRGIAGVAAMTGSSFSDIGNIFTSVAARGRAYSSDFNRIAIRGVAAFDVVAKHMGITVQQLQDKISDKKNGGLDSKTFIEAFSAAFAKQATKANKTYEGALANLRAAFSRLGATIQSVRLENLRKIYIRSAAAVDRFASTLKPVFKQLTKIDNGLRRFTNSFLNSRRMVGGTLKSGKKIKGFIWNISKAINGLMLYIKSIVKPIKKAYESVFGKIIGWRLANQLNKVAKNLNHFFNDVNVGTKSLAKSSKPLKTIFKGLFSLVDAGIKIFKIFIKITYRLTQTFFALTTGWHSIGLGLREFIKKINPVFNFMYKLDQLFFKQGTKLYKLGKHYNNLAKEVNRFKGIIVTYAKVIFNAFSNSIYSLRNIANTLLEPFNKVKESIKDFLNIKDADKQAKRLAIINDFLERKLTKFDKAISGISMSLDRFNIRLKELKYAISQIGIFKSISKDFDEFKKSFKFDLNASPFVVFCNILRDASELAHKQILKLLSLFSKSDKNNAYTNMKESFGGFGNTVKNILDSIKEMFGNLGKYISNFFNKFFGDNDFFSGLRSLTKSFTTSGFGVLLFQLSKSTKSLRENGIGITKMFNSISGTFGKLSKYLGTLQKAVNADIIFKIGKAVALLAGSIFVLSTIPADKLAYATGSVVAMIIGITGAMKSMNPILGQFSDSALKINKGGLSASGSGAAGPFSGLASALIALSVSIFVISLAVKKLGKMDLGQLIQGMAAMVIILGLMTGFGGALSEFEKGMEGGSTKGFKNGFERMAEAMKTMSKSLLISAFAMQIMGRMSWAEWGRGLLGILGIMAIFTIVAWVLNKFAKGDTMSLVKASSSKLSIPFKVSGKANTSSKTYKSGIEQIADAMKTMSKAMIIAGIALRIIAKALPDDEIFKRVMFCLAGLALIFIGISHSTSKLENIEKISILMKAFASMNAAFLVASLAIKRIASIDDSGLSKAIFMIGMISGIFVGLTLLSKVINPNKMKMLSVGFLALTGGLFIMAMAAKKISKISWEDIGKAVFVFASYLAALIITSYALAPVVPVVVALGAATLMIGVGMLAAATAIKIFVKALRTLDKIKDVESLFSKIMEFIPNFIANIIGAILNSILTAIPKIVDSLLDTIILILQALSDKLPKIVALAGKIFSSLVKEIIKITSKLDPAEVATVILSIGVMTAVMTALSYCGKIAKDAIKGVLVMGVAVGILVVLFQILLTNNKGEDVLKAALGFSAIMLTVAALMVVCALVGSLAAVAMSGLATLMIFTVVLTAFIAGLGFLVKQFPEIKEFVDKGGDLLYSLGKALGKFVAGLAEGILSSLPNIGKILSEFMKNLGPFLKGLKKITPGMIDASLGLVKIMLAFTAASLIQGIANFFGGGNILYNMIAFGKGLKELGPYVKSFAEEVKDIKPVQVMAAAYCVRMLNEVANNLPKKEGLWQKIFGETIDMATFGEQLASLGEALMSFYQEVSTIDAKKMKVSSNAVKTLVDLFNALPTEGGWAEAFTGKKQTLATFGKMLPDLAKGLVMYSKIISDGFTDEHDFGAAYRGLNKKSIKSMKQSIETVKMIIDMTKDMPTTDGAWQWLAGGKESLSSFAKQLPELAKGVIKYNQIISQGYEGKQTWNGLDEKGIDNIKRSIEAVNVVVGLAKNLPNTKGVVQAWFSGGQSSLQEFAEQLPSLADGVYKYVKKVNTSFAEGNIDLNNIELFTTIVRNVLDPFTDLAKDADVDEIKSLSDIIQSLSNFNVSALADGLKDEKSVSKLEQAAKDLGDLLVKAVKDSLDIKGERNEAKSSVSYAIGVTFTKSLLEGFGSYMKGQENNKNKSNPFHNAALTFVSVLWAAFQNKEIESKNKEIGENITNGLVKGMTDKDSLGKVRKAGKEIGKTAEKATKKQLKQKSPSKVFREIGKNNIIGLVDETYKNLSLVSSAYSTVGESASDNLSISMNTISDILSSDLDSAPTITPVLDLSNIQNGSNLINSMLGTDPMDLHFGVSNGLNRSYDKPKVKSKVYNDANVVSAIQDLQSDVCDLNDNMANMRVVMNTGELVGALSPGMDKSLGDRAMYEERGI